jgi:hypothetical protein
MIRVAFRYDDPRIFSRLVTLVRGGDSAHCEAAWDWTGTVHRCVSSSFLDGGVRNKTINLSPSKWRVYELPARQDPVTWGAAHAGRGYDVLGLLGIVWPVVGHSSHRWFCSEAVADILGLQRPQLFDLRSLESVCALIGRRVQ